MSGIALLVPTHRVLAARALLHRRRADILAKDPTDASGMLRELLEADQATGGFDARDARWIKVGVWALLASFAMKLMFHWLGT